MEIHIYQIFGIVIGIIAIVLSMLRFREGKMSLSMLVLWIFIWIMIIGISINPELTNLFASVTGIGRGLDFILIIGLIGCYYLIFKMYTMIENMEKEITKLVREIALQKETTHKKENIKNKSN
ncbi:DUF2304 domain-containing protein [Methanobacterium oryzae]|uniref:DUF2304 domain-containing protein n=1 Tax=Methanobacterium oryzae TaxID=69540 RepID=UPI003D1A180C